MQFLLRHAALAAEEAAGQARLLAALLDDLLPEWTGTELATDDVDVAGVAFRRKLPGLTSRERDVLALVAEGRSNKAIAEALFVSPNTVKTHVASLLTKFQVDSRTQLAAIAVRAGWSETIASIA
jgi:two-component system response regulator DegU